MDAAEWNRQTVLGWSEDVLQARVEELLRLHRWEFFHDQDSRRNRAGLPDIVAVRAGREPRLLFAELKTERGRFRADQLAWRDALQAVVGYVFSLTGDTPVEYHTWRPSDYLAGTIAQVLQ